MSTSTSKPKSKSKSKSKAATKAQPAVGTTASGGTANLPVVPAGSWQSLNPGLSPIILDTLTTLGFSSMTPVQSQTIPLFLKSKDVVVEAITGSGKTLAFVIPVIEMLLRRSRESPLKKNEVGAIIMSPTRELAIQIYTVLQQFLPHSPTNFNATDAPSDSDADDSSPPKPKSPLTHALYVGGSTSSLEDDLAHFRAHGSHIIVATPGRLEEFLKRGVGRAGGASGAMVNVKETEVVVLDEADRLLDLGFSRSLHNILAYLPKQRRTGLFSATMTDAVGSLISTGLRNPVKISVSVANAATGETWRTPATLAIGAITVTEESKLAWLVQCTRAWSRPGRKAIVYFATCKQVDYWYKILSSIPAARAWPWFSLHGQQTPQRRTAVFAAFAAADQAILLTTDVAARGLDVPNVDVIVQFDAPTDPKAFAHRCGRAGRAGRQGRAVVLLTEAEDAFVEFMEVRKVQMARVDAWGWGIMDADADEAQVKQLRASAQDAMDVDDDDASDSDIDDDGVTTTNSKAKKRKPAKIGSHYLTPSCPFSSPPELIADLFSQIVTLAKSDRDVIDKATLAFTSSIRSYSAHELSYIFQLKKTDLLSLIRMYALVKVPNMPELRSRGAALADALAEYERALGVDLDNVQYKDKAREAARLARVEKARAAAELTKGVVAANGSNKNVRANKGKSLGEAWSDQKEKKRRRAERKEKRDKRKAAIAKLKAEGKEYVSSKARRLARRAAGEASGSGSDSSDWDSSDSDSSEDDAPAKKRARGGAKEAVPVKVSTAAAKKEKAEMDAEWRELKQEKRAKKKQGVMEFNMSAGFDGDDSE